MRTKLLRVWLEGIKIAYPHFLDEIHPATIRHMRTRHIYPTFSNHITDEKEVKGRTREETFAYEWNPLLDYLSLKCIDKQGEQHHYILSLKRITQCMKHGGS